MKRINFEEAGMVNFGPYLDEMILRFENSKIVMMVGPNGVGKTMALDSIPFTLYGITSKGIKGDDVVNNKIKKDCHTWVKFKIDDDSYEVNRYQKHKKHGNTVILSKNGEILKKGHKEVLPLIENLICPAKSFMNTLMFGQKVKDFFTDLTDSDKKEIFRKVLALDNYILYYDKAKEKYDEIKQQILSVDMQLKSIERVIEEITTYLQIELEKKKKFEENRSNELISLSKLIQEKKHKLESLQIETKEFDKLQDFYLQIKREIIQIEEEIKKINYQLQQELKDLDNKASLKVEEIKTEAQKRINEIKNKYYKLLKDKIADKNEELRILEKNLEQKTEEINKRFRQDVLATENINSINKELQKLESNLKEEICPTCLQKINATGIEKVKSHINQLIQKMKDIEENRDKNKIELTKLEKEKQEILKVKQELKNEITNIESEIEKDQQNEINQITEKSKEFLIKVSELRNQKKEEIEISYSKDKINAENLLKEKTTKMLYIESELNKIKNLVNQKNNLETEISVLINNYKLKENEKFDSREEEFQTQISNKMIEGERFKQTIEELNTKLQIVEFWKDAFSNSGIPSMLVDEAIPFMNERIAYYLDLLTNGRYIVSFDTLSTTKSGEIRDKICVNLLDTYTNSNLRGQFSGGQTRLVDIATILTLGDLQSRIQNVSINILLFDEIFDSLDSENVANVAKVLTKIKSNRSIYIISHMHQDHVEPDEILEFRK